MKIKFIVKKALVINPDGSSFTSNWSLDMVIDCFDNLGVEHNDELIKNLTINQIEYGRTCLFQFVARQLMLFTKENPCFEYVKKSDLDMQQKIIELGGIPRNSNIALLFN